MNSFLLIEGCNFINRPVGGQLSFAKQLIQVYGNKIYLVGVTDDENIQVGKWTKLTINNIEFDFFPFRRLPSSNEKPRIPARISDYLAIKKYEKEILSKNKNIITQAPELLIAMRNWNIDTLCYEFPGVENPLEMPRFKWGKFFAKQYENTLFKILNSKVNVILASAGIDAINNLVNRSDGLLKNEEIFQFPTRVDTSFFKPLTLNRIDFKLSNTDKILISCGRINHVKGWELIIDSFNILIQKNKNLKLFFIGDGEDRSNLEEKINKYNLSNHVTVIGFQTPNQVLEWINLADIVLVGSYKEGWSISMLEALACGKPIVSTNVSGSKEMIIEGQNGFIVDTRKAQEYADKINDCFELKDYKNISLSIANKYSLMTLKPELDRLWIRK